MLGHDKIMKHILVILFIVVCFSSFAQTDENFKLYYDSGKLQTEEHYYNSCNCDSVIEYFENGKVRSRKAYLHNLNGNSQIDGAAIVYFENGNIQMYNFWKNGAFDGRNYCNFSDGKLAYEKYFSSKYKSGIWRFYNPNGLLNEELIYENEQTPWNSNDDYANDKFYDDGKLAYTVKLKAGKKSEFKIINKALYYKWNKTNEFTGKTIFLQNCSMCHTPNNDVVGPMLKGVANKRSDLWLTQMITNGTSLVNQGDKEAVELYEKWDKIEHPNFESLSNEKILKLVKYIKTLK